MSRLRSVIATPSTSRGIVAAAPLNRAEQVVLLVVVSVALLFTLLSTALGGEPFTFAILLDLAITASFAVFLVSPPVAVLLFAAAMVVAFFSGWDGPAFSALSVATAVVVRTGSVRVIVSFGGLLLLTAAAIAIVQPSEPVVVGVGLLISVIAGAAGFLLRSARGREQRLAEAAREQAAVMDQIRRDERLLIADELHDVIAHDLTVIAMQTRVMERQRDPELLAQTQQEIGDAARRALHDIRRLIAPGHGEAQPERIDDFEATLAQMEATLRAAGYAPEVTADLSQPLPRLVDATLARVLRESTTNIIKHGRVGPVGIHVGADAQTARLQVSNDYSVPRVRTGVPSGGFGSTRLAERVDVLGGEFVQATEGDAWVVRATLPLA
ncbi:Sensor histidine kinase DesK [Microbacterium oxydans]|uniref:sensor histidine kinase n=1 Tax=Microbacterium oxydans TaxID=82380 RepID=UPI001E12E1D7|nr:histidine kinase [Microbacterium oxydans]CAH0245571.1 Sensor histidine kinase DesK [Microbacterium oxydans]